MSSTPQSPNRRDVLRWAGIGAAAGGAALALPGTAWAQPGNGRRIFVRADAGPGGDGRSPVHAFDTLQAAADVTEPGDTVWVMDGVYRDTETQINQGPLGITRSGAPGAPITYAAFPGHRPVVTVSPNAWNAIKVTNAAYIVIEGFAVVGTNEQLSYDEAFANQSRSVPTFNANGIFAADSPDGTGPGCHHIVIRNNLVRHWPGGGIAAKRTDYLTVEGNTVHSNAWYNVYANSGITTLRPSNTDQTTGHRTFIVRNICYRNESFIPWFRTQAISDGNGIIIDSTRVDPTYIGRTYVANNLSFANGGSGIHSFNCADVDIVNNTVFENSQSPALRYPGVYARQSRNTNLLNNIVVSQPGEPSNSNINNENVVYDYTLYAGGEAPVVTGANDLVADPLLVNPSTDPGAADFHLRAGSPAIGSGTADLAPDVDYDGRRRDRNAIDRGAYRFRR